MSVKNIKARGYITLVRIKDGEKGDRGDAGPKGDNGRDADFYRLRPLAEFANVDADGTLYVGLSYGADHIVGNTVTAQSLKATGLTVEARGNNNDYPRVEMTAGDVASGFTYIPDYVNASNRPDFFIVELKRGAQILDVKTVRVAMYAASYVKVVGDMRTSVSQQGKDISVIKQNAQSLTLRVDSLKTGIRNLLTGGKYERTFRGYGFTYNLQKGKYIKLEAEKDYTLTVCGRISQSAKDKGQLLHFYVFTPNWTWCDHIEISNVTDSIASVKFRIPAGKKTSDDMYIVDGYPFPSKDESGGNGEVTVNWVTITEGAQPASDWIPSKEESGEERVKAVELKLENGEFRIMSNRTVFVDNSGKESVLIQNGKLSADLIDAKEVRTTPGDSGLHIEMYEGTFDIFVKGNKKGISMTVDKDGFPHLIFFDKEGNAKYDLGYTGLKELVSAYRAAYWTKIKLVNITDKGLAAVYPHTDNGKEWMQYHAAFHYATGNLGEHAEEDRKVFESESFHSPIPNGWYTDENKEGQYPTIPILAEDDEGRGKEVWYISITRYENGRASEIRQVYFIVQSGKAFFCKPDGKPLVVNGGLLQNYPVINE